MKETSQRVQINFFMYFIWQGTQWVKPIRYFLPVYPTLILLAAWILIEIIDFDPNRYFNKTAFLSNNLFVWARYMIVAGVVVSTLLYAFAFTRIYTRPVTRVSASDWIYQNVPGPFSVVIENENETNVQPLPMPTGFIYENGDSYSIMFTPKINGMISKVKIGHIGDVSNDDESEVFHVALSQVADRDDVLAEATLDADFASNSGRANEWSCKREKHYLVKFQVLERIILNIN